MRQDQQASGLYFLLSGEVSVTQTTYDEVTEQYVTREVAKRRGGTMFGEVSMLHKIPRTATITTLSKNKNLIIKFQIKNFSRKCLPRALYKFFLNVNICMKYFCLTICKVFFFALLYILYLE